MSKKKVKKNPKDLSEIEKAIYKGSIGTPPSGNK